MQRIYFDVNVFNLLKQASDLRLQNFCNDLKSYKSNFLFCYSHSHMLDLQRDNTEKKFEDLEFMESIVDDNYIIQYWGSENAHCYRYTPKDAFEDLDPITKTEGITNFDSLFSGTPELAIYGDLMKSILSSQTFDLGSLREYNQSNQDFNAINNIFNFDKESISMLDISNRVLEMYGNISTDEKTFKELRHLIIEYLNPGMDKINYLNPNFNEILKDTIIQKTFLEYVTTTLNPDGKKKISKQDFFIQAYYTLNLFGIDREKNKKAKFTNTFHDALHSYYAAHCDIVVSEETSFLIKTKLLYNLLNIDTNVYHINDFIPAINLLYKGKENDATDFIKLLRFELTNGFIIKSYVTSTLQNITIAKSYHTFFNFFNRIKQVFETKSNTSYIILYREKYNYSAFYFYKEIETVTNNILKILGLDLELKGDYTVKDEQEIVNSSWQGRIWEFDQIRFTLEINVETKLLNLVIGPL